jgi:hypothetical protein
MVGWLVDERGIEPHVNLIDKSERTDGTFSRSDFVSIQRAIFMSAPGQRAKEISPRFRQATRRADEGRTMIYFARKEKCGACALKPKCCPNVPARKIARSVHEAA